MSKYFAKWLDVKKKVKNGEYGINVKCILPDHGNYVYKDVSIEYDTIVIQGNKTLFDKKYAKKVQLFLCSRDIQIGDHYQWQDSDSSIGHGIKITAVSPDAYKIIGPISPEAEWVKEGDEFEENQVATLHSDGELLNQVKNTPKSLLKNCIIKVKCPCCGEFK